ncbi:MAG: outer membrane protein assembly factor BamD [Proteobacteria bacterium]|nr:outer membrane protein assembly factor BamD [Pseudomonadota bacterium]
MKITKLLFISTVILFSCSSTSDKGTNSISPYDINFDPDQKKEAEKLSDLPEAQLLNDARSAYDKQLYSVSKESWTKLKDTYPGSFYATLAELKIADCLYYSGDFPGAVSAYEDFLKLHPAHEASAYVIFQIGNSYKEQYTGIEHDQQPLVNAINNYKKVVELHKDTEFYEVARKSKIDCEEKMAAHEAFIAEFYLKQGKDQAYKARLQKIIKDYNDTKFANWARGRLGIKEIALNKDIAKENANELNSDEVKRVVDQVLNDRPKEKAVADAVKPKKIKPLKEELSKKAKAPISGNLNADTYSFSCEKQNGNFVFTILLPVSVIIKDAGSNPESKQYLLVEKNSPIETDNINFTNSNKPASECVIENIKVQVNEIFSKSIDKSFLKVSYNKNETLTDYQFTLDRPNRFVLILHPKSF